MLRHINGNIFNSKALVLGNTNNTEGVHGAGMALEMSCRFPDATRRYREMCKRKIYAGDLLIIQEGPLTLLHFLVKDSWREPSQLRWVTQSLQRFIGCYSKQGFKHVALPLMGTQNGGLDVNVVRQEMTRLLERLPNVDIELYTFNPLVPCPEFRYLARLLSMPGILNLLVQQNVLEEEVWLRIHSEVIRLRRAMSMFPGVFRCLPGNSYARRTIITALFQVLRTRPFAEMLLPVRRVIVVGESHQMRELLEKHLVVDPTCHTEIVGKFNSLVYSWALTHRVQFEALAGCSSVWGDELLVVGEVSKEELPFVECAKRQPSLVIRYVG